MSNFKRHILKSTIPIQKAMQKVHLPERKVRGDFYLAARALARDGDCLLSREDWHFTNPYIPGWMKHAAILHGDWVIEAIAGGVREVLFVEWVLTKDYIEILRPPLSAELARQAAEWCWSKRGHEYDYLFEGENEEYFCNELLECAYQIRLKNVFSKYSSVPTDFYVDPRFIKILSSRSFSR